MNVKHLGAFLWLRWRLLANQWRRAGTFNFVLMMIITVAAVLTAIPLFFGSFFLGTYLIPKALPIYLMYAWDGLIAAFLFFWGIGVITELQRSEPLSISKFLHLPVSVTGAFLINYVSSLLRLSLIIFVPIMLGFSLALIRVLGLGLLPVLPAVGAMLFMVTALTYQLQGWLAALMSNPRRRRTVIMATTMSFVLLAQLPNLINFFSPWGFRQREERSRAAAAKLKSLEDAAVPEAPDAGTDPDQVVRRLEDLAEKQRLAIREAERASNAELESVARLANQVVPVGWLPAGVIAAAEGRVIPSLFGIAGMSTIGAISLWRAYRTTVGLYQGGATNSVAPARMAAVAQGERSRGDSFMETRFPGLSDPVSAVALASLRSLIRSPEAKMMLLTPLIMIPIFGSMLWRGRNDIPGPARPLVAVGAMMTVLFGLMQLMGNQFGMDRDGFKFFVLSPAPGRQILLGKNMAFVPIAVAMAVILLVLAQIVIPIRLDHLIASLPQYISMYLMFCILANFQSIYAPFHVAPGSLQPANPKVTTILIQLLMFMVLFPLTQAVTLLPLGIEVLLRYLGWGAGIPIYLVLSVVVCVIVVFLYRFSLHAQGQLLETREQSILESVTNRAP